MKLLRKQTVLALLILFFIMDLHLFSSACTRVVYKGKNGVVLTGRTMDWSEAIPANLWLFPKGLYREGAVEQFSKTWESKYASLVASSWNAATTDGINEKGLVGNLLWLGETVYPTLNKEKKSALTVTMWLQFILDNYGSVKEAVRKFEKENLQVLPVHLPLKGKLFPVTLHLSISDPTGDSAIFEYIDGKLQIHHNKLYTTMTNSPSYPEQLLHYSRWKGASSVADLPGSNHSSDRFVRASFYLESIPKLDSASVATPMLFSILRSISTPYLFSVPNRPNNSSTQWRTVADQKKLIYYFEDVTSPNVIWVDFQELVQKGIKGTMMLDLSKINRYNNEVSSHFIKAKPFPFLGPFNKLPEM